VSIGLISAEADGGSSPLPDTTIKKVSIGLISAAADGGSSPLPDTTI